MATHYRTCPFCEATCGLEVETEGREVVAVRGDARGRLQPRLHLPQGARVKQLHEDPDRLTHPAGAPRRRAGRGELGRGVRGDRARLSPILDEHGRNAVAVYVGNPNAHNLSALIYGPVWLRALGSQNLYTASTVDQMPKQVSAGLDVRHDLLRSPSPTWTAASTC